MKNSYKNIQPIIPDHFNFEKIEASDDFALKVMEQIERRNQGGFGSLSSASKVAFMAVTLLIYSSIGALIGIQSHKNNAIHISDSKKKAIIDLRRVHHLDPVSSFDNILRPFETNNN